MRWGSSGPVERPAATLKTTMEMALVGPLMRCDDEPNTDATAVMMTAVYSP